MVNNSILDSSHYKNDNQHRQKEPDGDDDTGGCPVCRFALAHGCLSLFPALGQNGLGNHLQCKSNTQRNQDEVIQISQDGDGIWNQIYRAEGISNYASGENPGVPRSSGIFVSQIDGVGLYLELSSSLLPCLNCFQSSSVFLSLVILYCTTIPAIPRRIQQRSITYPHAPIGRKALRLG